MTQLPEDKSSLFRPRPRMRRHILLRAASGVASPVWPVKKGRRAVTQQFREREGAADTKGTQGHSKRVTVRHRQLLTVTLAQCYSRGEE